MKLLRDKTLKYVKVKPRIIECEKYQEETEAQKVLGDH